MVTESDSEQTLHVFHSIPFVPTAETVLRAMRVRKVSPSLSRLTEELVAESREIAKPKALCRVVYVNSRSEQEVNLDGHVFTSRVLRQNLEGIQRVFPFVATCGTEFQPLMQDRTDIMAAYCLDTIMMLAMDTARRHIQSFIKDTFSLRGVSRMAPGSLKDWPIEQQRPLFDLLGDVQRLIGVTLTDKFLMLPVKSTSGIFFPTEVRFESCQLCPRPNCSGRRSPYDATLVAKYGV